MKRSSILTMAVIIIVVVASFGLYGLLNSSHKDFLGAPLPIIVRNTPHAYMEVNFTNLSGFTDGYSISFSALTKNISVSSIELNTINGTYSGFVRFNNVSSVYTLNMSPSSIFNVTINGGNVFSDSTYITIKLKCGTSQTLSSVKLIDFDTAGTIVSGSLFSN